MNIDDTLKENYSKLNKKRVNQTFEIVTSVGNCFRISVIYNCRGNYGYMLERQNNITGKFEYYQSNGYFPTRKRVYQVVESNITYLYNNL